jgi:UDP-glucose:(heptosyl)LPS alpha-1,3-glucosyltransferase
MEKRLKFATAILDFSTRKGGAERYLVDLCTRMAKEGHEVHVYAEHWDEEIPDIVLHKVNTIPFPKSLRLLSFAIKATKQMDEGNYDITLGVGNTLKADILQPHGGVHWAWFWRSLEAYENPIIWIIKFLGRILSPHQWISGYIEGTPYRRKNYDKIIAISDMVKEDVINWYKVPEDRIEVVYNGVDIERFNPKNRKYREIIRTKHGIGNEFVILFVSNNFRMKGLKFLIKALAKIKKDGGPSLKLIILGRDNNRTYLRLAKRLEFYHDLIFVGSTHEIEKYYGASDLMVHPTFYDACSLSVLEALASGLPVITTSSNGVSRIITDKSEGIVISTPKEIDKLAESIKFFLDSEILTESLKTTRKVVEKYSIERNWLEIKRIFNNHYVK